MKLYLDEIATILGSPIRPPNGAAEHASIDSRTLTPGSLFFAIRGARLDGHRFVVEALNRGAVAAVVEEAFHAQASPNIRDRLIPVPDTLQALHQLARAVRRRWNRTLIAVTGSTGKTTTKELIAAVLATHWTVHKSAGNLNNQFGVPLTLLGLDRHHDVAVVEMGMSAGGEITRLARMAEPEIGVITNVAPVHLEYFESLDAIAAAKRELIENLKAPATAVLNYDDPRVRRFADGFEGRVVTYGLNPGADFYASHVELRLGQTPHQIGTSFQVQGPGIYGDFYLPLPGRHSVENALAAIATARAFAAAGSADAINPEDLRRAFQGFKPVQQRMEISILPSGATVINDSYNSNPRAMEQMLDTLANWPGVQRRIAVAGEMLELGPSSPDWHRAIGRQCGGGKVDWLIAVQGDARYFLEGAREAGLRAEQGRFFATAKEAGAFCRRLVHAGDVVLVKGSRGVHLEEVVEMLRAAATAEPDS
jgi:UDP-N-acetylmuramoyl-tripeptide--D-alanyl-D-alanine ligase